MKESPGQYILGQILLQTCNSYPLGLLLDILMWKYMSLYIMVHESEVNFIRKEYGKIGIFFFFDFISLQGTCLYVVKKEIIL